MSDNIKHECGLAFIRLRKPFSYFQQKYGSIMWALNKMYLLMEKQHNRGQDGAGLAVVKLNVEPGYPFLHRYRTADSQPIAKIFAEVGREIEELAKFNPEIKNHPGLMKGHISFLGELLLGHLRYGTQGRNNTDFCHPFIKRNISPATNLALAGNFNLINVDELFSLVNIDPGVFQKQSDLAAMMEIICHFLEKEDEKTPNDPDIISVLKKAMPLFDGGYNVGGITGHGVGFVFRDPYGIRPSYYYINDEVIVAASERAAIRTTFNVGENEVQELMPGCALLVDTNGRSEVAQIVPSKERKACSFERIYFSRGSDEKIYKERNALGYNLSQQVLEAVDYDLKNTIFSFIPNTAETAFYGMLKGMENYLNQRKIDKILSWGNNVDADKLTELLQRKIRIEKVAIKDVKMRTFITEDATRAEMVQHVYDITYGVLKPEEDNLVIIDDSIVRGTTLKASIITMLARLKPKKIIVVSSAPQICYPDCYGIDMSKMGDFVAFNAAVQLLEDNGESQFLQDMLATCKELKRKDLLHTENVVRQLYQKFTPIQIAKKISRLITPEHVTIPVEVIFQTIDNLHKACPSNLGDWYFTGNYPTPGGNKVVNNAFINYMEGQDKRGY